jgi:hypothetical protein
VVATLTAKREIDRPLETDVVEAVVVVGEA